MRPRTNKHTIHVIVLNLLATFCENGGFLFCMRKKRRKERKQITKGVKK